MLKPGMKERLSYGRMKMMSCSSWHVWKELKVIMTSNDGHHG